MKRNTAGFSLMEIMIALVIIGILVTIAVPYYGKAVERSRMTEAFSQLDMIRKAEYSYYTQYSEYSETFNLLDMSDPNSSDPASRYFKYDLVRDTLPNPRLATATRNGTNNPTGAEYTITMFEDGSIEINDKKSGGSHWEIFKKP